VLLNLLLLFIALQDSMFKLLHLLNVLPLRMPPFVAACLTALLAQPILDVAGVTMVLQVQERATQWKTALSVTDYGSLIVPLGHVIH